jgi:hypothetical protein
VFVFVDPERVDFLADAVIEVGDAVDKVAGDKAEV